jgi:hypothetical protein
VLGEAGALAAFLTHYSPVLEQIRSLQEIKIGHYEAGVRQITQLVASTLKLDRVGVFLSNFVNGELVSFKVIDLFENKTHSRTGGLAEKDGFGYIGLELYPTYARRLQSQRVTWVRKNDMEVEDTEVLAELKDYMNHFNVELMMDSPIYANGHHVGLLCCEQYQDKESVLLQQAQQIFIATCADMLSDVLLSLQRQENGMLLQHITNLQARSVVRKAWGHGVAPMRKLLHKAACHGGYGGRYGGYVSEEMGFLPPKPIPPLPASHQAWENFAVALPQHVASGKVGQALALLPEWGEAGLLDGRPTSLARCHGAWVGRARVLVVRAGRQERAPACFPPTCYMHGKQSRTGSAAPPLHRETLISTQIAKQGSISPGGDLFLHNWTTATNVPVPVQIDTDATRGPGRGHTVLR